MESGGGLKEVERRSEEVRRTLTFRWRSVGDPGGDHSQRQKNISYQHVSAPPEQSASHQTLIGPVTSCANAKASGWRSAGQMWVSSPELSSPFTQSLLI